MEHIDRLSQQNEEITGLPTGYPELDKMTAGLQPEELIILAARPAVGKTAFALNIAQILVRGPIAVWLFLVWKWGPSLW